MARALFEYRYEVGEEPSLLFRDSGSILVTLHRPSLSIQPSDFLTRRLRIFFLSNDFFSKSFISRICFLGEAAYRTPLYDQASMTLVENDSNVNVLSVVVERRSKDGMRTIDGSRVVATVLITCLFHVQWKRVRSFD